TTSRDAGDRGHIVLVFLLRPPRVPKCLPDLSRQLVRVAIGSRLRRGAGARAIGAWHEGVIVTNGSYLRVAPSRATLAAPSGPTFMVFARRSSSERGARVRVFGGFVTV